MAVGVGEVLVTGLGAAITAAVTAGVNAFLETRKKQKGQAVALQELVTAAEMVINELEPESQKAMQVKIDASRAALA